MREINNILYAIEKGDQMNDNVPDQRRKTDLNYGNIIDKKANFKKFNKILAIKENEANYKLFERV